MLGTGWIILIVVVTMLIVAMISGGSSINRGGGGGGKSLNILKKNFGVISLFLILISGLMLMQ